MSDKQVVQFEDYALSMDTAQGMAGLMKAASMLAQSDIIPKAFKEKPANVLIALEMANRMGASPFAVMQSMYIVYGNPSFSSKFLIACFNSCGRYTSIKYEFFGDPKTDGYGCHAWATEKATGEVVKSVDVTIGMAKAEGWVNKDGSKWKTIIKVHESRSTYGYKCGIRKNVYLDIMPIKKKDYLWVFVLTCMGSLYILDIIPLSDK